MSAPPTTKERLALIEKDIAGLKQAQSGIQSKRNWIAKITGTFKDDPEFGEILRLGRENRQRFPMR